MKPHERRAANKFPYYKLAVWDRRNLTWRDGKRAHDTEDSAKTEAMSSGPGRFRISVVTDAGRRDLEPFDVN